MAKKVFVDSERLRKFTSDLKMFQGKVEELTTHLAYNMARLSESWRDQEFEKFREEFIKSQQKLRKFIEEVKKTTPKLEDDARAADMIHEGILPR